MKPPRRQHSGAEEQTARAISTDAQCACLLSLQMESNIIFNKTTLKTRQGLKKSRNLFGKGNVRNSSLMQV